MLLLKSYTMYFLSIGGVISFRYRRDIDSPFSSMDFTRQEKEESPVVEWVGDVGTVPLVYVLGVRSDKKR